MINNSTHGKKQFSVHLLNSTSFGEFVPKSSLIYKPTTSHQKPIMMNLSFSYSFEGVHWDDQK